MDPHVGAVGGADAVAEPFVPTFVDDDEVEPRRDADTGPVALEIAVREMIAVRNGALVFHAGVRCFDQLVAVFLEWILTEIMLIGCEHPARLGELLFRFVQIFRQRVKVERQITEVFRPVLVLADVH